MMSTDNSHKDVYIVGTGIAGSLIAKTLTDCVVEVNKIINRTTANSTFKENLKSIGYFNDKNSNIIEIKKLIDENGKMIPFGLDKKDDKNNKAIANEILKSVIDEYDKLDSKPNGDKNIYLQKKFEKAYFESFYKEINMHILEAGLNDGVKLDSSNNFKNYSSYMKKFSLESAKVPNSPYPKLKQADSPNVLDFEPIPLPNPSTKGYLVQKGPIPFLSDHIRVGGGTTMHWLGTTPRMLPNDFALTPDMKVAKIKDENIPANYYKWPIEYDDIKPYYELAEFEIGVSGDVEKQVYPTVENPKKDVKNNFIVQNIEQYYDAYKFPMQEIPQSYMDLQIIEELKSKTISIDSREYPILLTSTPQGRNSIPNSDYDKIPEIKLDSKKVEYTKDKRDKKDIMYSLYLNKSSESYKALGAVWNPYMGERCEGNASCVPICPVQAKYNALKSLKKAFYKEDWKGELIQNNSITVQGQSVVYKLSVGTDQSISKIHLRKYKSQDKTDFVEETIDTSKSIVILAGNALENPKILLNSKYTILENIKNGPNTKDKVILEKDLKQIKNEISKGQHKGKVLKEYSVSNRSDQVGRNLMDHQVMLTWGLAKKPVYPFRGPGSTTNISTFRDGQFRKDHAAWISPLDNWGWGWPTFAPGSDLEEFLAKGLFGKELRNAIEDRVTRQVLFHFEVEQLPNPNNRITISDNYLDALGIPRPIIEYNISEYEKKALEQAKLASDQMFAILDIEDFTNYSPNDKSAVEYNGKIYNFNGAGHIVGTHRMGSDAGNSVTNSYSQSWDHENLYVVGAGSMPTLGTSNPTLTLAALAIRSCESILTDLKVKK